MKFWQWVLIGAIAGGVYGYNKPKDCLNIPIIKSACNAWRTPGAVVQYSAIGGGVGGGVSLLLSGGLNLQALLIGSAIAGTAFPAFSPVPKNTGGQITKPKYTIPTTGVLSQGYHPAHIGIDIANAVGTPVVAIESGTVVFAGWDDWGLGNAVKIQHSNGNVSVYGHNSQLYVQSGDTVNKGDAIAAMGSTGNSTGPHLHFEYHTKGTAIDACQAFYQKQCKGGRFEH